MAGLFPSYPYLEKFGSLSWQRDSSDNSLTLQTSARLTSYPKKKKAKRAVEPRPAGGHAGANRHLRALGFHYSGAFRQRRGNHGNLYVQMWRLYTWPLNASLCKGCLLPLFFFCWEITTCYSPAIESLRFVAPTALILKFLHFLASRDPFQEPSMMILDKISCIEDILHSRLCLSGLCQSAALK